MAQDEGGDGRRFAQIELWKRGDQRHIAGYRDDVGVTGEQLRLAQFGAKNLDVRNSLALEALDQDQVARRQLGKRLVPGQLPPELALNVAKARAFKLVKTIEVTLEPESESADEYGFRDFSREGIENRRVTGRAIALSTLRPEFDQL